MFAAISGSFVKKSGDDMTGSLNMSSGWVKLNEGRITEADRIPYNIYAAGSLHTTSSLTLALLGNYNVQANTLFGSQDVLNFVASGYASGNNGSKTLEFYFGGQLIYSHTITAGASTKYWNIWLNIYKLGTTSQKCTFNLWTQTIGDAGQSGIAISANLAALCAMEIKGKVANAADVIASDSFQLNAIRHKY